MWRAYRAPRGLIDLGFGKSLTSPLKAGYSIQSQLSNYQTRRFSECLTFVLISKLEVSALLHQFRQ